MERTAQIKKLIEDIASGKLSRKSALDTLLMELGRGGRILVVDENLRGLDAYLINLNYTVYNVRPGDTDEEIKAELSGRILVTKNGQDFDGDNEQHYYGLIWVVNRAPFRLLAKKIEAILMREQFKKNLTHTVKL